jgi:hypothetical protein
MVEVFSRFHECEDGGSYRMVLKKQLKIALRKQQSRRSFVNGDLSVPKFGQRQEREY